MRRTSTSSVLILGVALHGLATGSAQAQQTRAQEQCGTCHPTQRVAHEASVHALEMVRCTSCHGGSGEALEVDAAHGGSFRSLRQHNTIPAACAVCHADLEMMRPYDLPVDQSALYETSRHGRAVASGNRRAAVCTDCHGGHEIRSSSDPESLVHPRNLPSTCGRCHDDAKLMDEFELDVKVVADYRSSVHGRARYDLGNLAAPTCTGCHGIHGAAPPGVGALGKVCGRCHVPSRRAFLQGPHSTAKARVAECATCHSNHAIVNHTTAEIVATCSKCHAEGSPETTLGEQLYSRMAAAEEEIREADELVARAEEIPLYVEDHRARLEEARTYVAQARLLVHTVDLAPVEQMTRRARSIGEEVQRELKQELDLRASRVGLAVFWFYLVMTLAVLFRMRLRLGRERAVE